MPSLPGYASAVITSYHCVLFRSSPFVITTSPTLTSGSLLLCFKLCLSRSDVDTHLSISFMPLPCIFACTFCLFCKSLFSIFVRSLLGITGFELIPVNLVLKLEIGYLLLCWINSLLFNVVSISVSTSPNSFHSNFDFSTVLCNVFLTRVTILSN